MSIAEPTQRGPSTASLALTMAAASTRILPSDEGPGAGEAGVAEHLGRALEEPFLRPLERIFARGCEILDAHGEQRVGRPFVECEPAVQDEILFALQRDGDPWARLFFEWLIKLTLEGFLCDPVHGGNRQQVGWHFLGLHREEPRSGFCLGDGEER